jgi:uncharacterized protein (DUF697 family)
MKAFTIGGPKFWLAYVAAAGNGMCSLAFVNWFRSRLGLPEIAEAEGEPVFLTALVFLVFISLFFFLAWKVVSRRYEGHPDLPNSKRLLILVFAASAPLTLSLIVAQAVENYTVETEMYSVVLMAAAVILLALIPVPFSVRDPRHGFFCAQLSMMTALGPAYGFEEPGHIELYIVGIRMAVVYLYFILGVWPQRVIAIVASVVVGCSPGMLGAAVGTISWAIRRKRTRQRR